MPIISGLFLPIGASLSFALGLWLILSEKFKFPTSAQSHVVAQMSKKTDVKIKKLDVLTDGWAQSLAPFVPMNEYSERKMAYTLKACGIPKTPKEYLANALINAMPFVLFAVLLYLVHPILTIALAAMAIVNFYQTKNRPAKILYARQKAIEAELPRFVNQVLQDLKGSQDIVTIMDNYTAIAGESLKKELKITVADMRSGNAEEALLRLESRVSSPMMSGTTRGLVSAVRGDDAISHFQMLSHDYHAIEFSRLEGEAMKRPEKLTKYKMAMLFTMLLLWFTVMGIRIFNSATMF